MQAACELPKKEQGGQWSLRPEKPIAGVGFLNRGQLIPSPSIRGFGDLHKLPRLTISVYCEVSRQLILLRYN